MQNLLINHFYLYSSCKDLVLVSILFSPKYLEIYAIISLVGILLPLYSHQILYCYFEEATIFIFPHNIPLLGNKPIREAVIK